MDCASSCSCRLGRVVRALDLGSRPSPKKRQWQFVSSAILSFFAFFFYIAITRNIDPHGALSLAVCSFLGGATFLAGLLTAIVGTIGCDDCVSRM